VNILNISFKLKGDAHNCVFNVATDIVSPIVWQYGSIYNSNPVNPVRVILHDILQGNIDASVHLKSD